MTALLVAATGGHLAQLHQLRRRFPAIQGQDVVWVTFDTPQSQSLLAGEDVIYVPLTRPRDYRHVATNAWRARRILKEVAPEFVVSTGSAVALSFLPLAAGKGIGTHYVESAARSDGPSLTGRLLARDPRIHLYTQHEGWAGTPWEYRGSVFDAWRAAKRPRSGDIRRAVVTLGTMDFSFRRLVERLVDIIPPDVEVIWQTGATDVSDLRIDAQPTLPSVELSAAVATADVVISHAGCGSAMQALEHGSTPVLVPREQRYREHIDDHQRQIAVDLAARGLAVHGDASDLTWTQVVAAADTRAQTASPLAAFDLDADDGDEGVIRRSAIKRFQRSPQAAPDQSSAA